MLAVLFHWYKVGDTKTIKDVSRWFPELSGNLLADIFNINSKDKYDWLSLFFCILNEQSCVGPQWDPGIMYVRWSFFFFLHKFINYIFVYHVGIKPTFELVRQQRYYNVKAEVDNSWLEYKWAKLCGCASGSYTTSN